MKKKILCIIVVPALTKHGMSPYPKGTSERSLAKTKAATPGMIYYVNNTNPSCSDTLNDGLSASAPFCTIVGPTIVEVVYGGLWPYSVHLPLVLRDY
jgi:hypothetical protein